MNNRSGVMGNLNDRTPVASSMALERAAATGTSAISPIPIAPNGPDFSKFSTGTTSGLHFGEGIDLVCGEIVDRHLS